MKKRRGVRSKKSCLQRRRPQNGKKKSVKFQSSPKNYQKTKPKDKVAAKEDQGVPQNTDGSSVSLAASTEYFCYGPTKKHHCWALTSLKAPYYESSARSSVDIVAVIDKSSSMRGEKISLVRKTLLFVIDQLKDTDRLSLVVYDTNVTLLFGLMKMNKENKEKARTFVSSIHDGTTTNLFGGLRKGMEQIAVTNAEEKSQVQSVLLLTDGLANYGIRSTAEIVEQMKVMQDKGIGAVSTSSSSSFSDWSFGNVQSYQTPSRYQAPPRFQAPSRYQVSRPPIRQTMSQPRRAFPPPLQRARQTHSSQVPVRRSLRLQQKQKTSSARGTKQQVSRNIAGQIPNQARVISPAKNFPSTKPIFGPVFSPCISNDQPCADDTANSSCKFDGTVYTFGFGSDHDASMLEAISTQGGGMYYYIDSFEKIPETFADCIGGLLSVMGQNVSVKLEAQENNIIKKVHTSRSVCWRTPHKNCEVAMGDIQSEESRDLVLELELPPMPYGRAYKNNALVNVQVSYFNVITSQHENVECKLVTNRMAGNCGQGNMTVDIQKNRVLVTNAIKRAEELGDSNKIAEAQKILKDAIASLMASLSKEEGLVKLLLLDLDKCLNSMNTRESFKSHGKNYMRSKHQTHSVQRTNFVYGGKGKRLEAFGYGNVSKRAYRMKSKVKKH